MRKISMAVALALAFGIGGCTRIETGEVGLRLNASKQIEGAELMEGTWNQTVIGDVLTFPVRDVPITLESHHPITKDGPPLADFDLTATYAINPSCVSDLWSKKSRTFHTNQAGDWYLMHAFMHNAVSTASWKAVREFTTMEAPDKRSQIEARTKEILGETLKSEKLENCLSVSTVQVKSVVPNAEILASYTASVRASADLARKTAEVELAKKEAERMEALSKNAGQSIAYMQAQAQMKIANGIEAGKVQTIIVPMNFNGMLNVGK
jgi:hypothetical protein